MRFLKKNNNGDPSLFVTRSGSRKKKIYGPRFDGKSLTLIDTGEMDIQDEINSHAMECDMSFILSRLGQGDTSVLHPGSPIFADFHDLPANFREVLDVALNTENIFNKLPVEVRKQFDNDYREFIYKAGTPEWNAIMNPDQAGAQTDVKEVVKDGEGEKV